MTTSYTFSVNLLYTYDGQPGLLLWQSGTMTLDLAASPAVTGVLTLPDLGAPIPFSGSVTAMPGYAPPAVAAAGQNSQNQIELTCTYLSDGVVYEGTYIGGLVDILDSEEWNPYVLQGYSPQGPFGADAQAGQARKQARSQS